MLLLRMYVCMYVYIQVQQTIGNDVFWCCTMESAWGTRANIRMTGKSYRCNGTTENGWKNRPRVTYDRKHRIAVTGIGIVYAACYVSTISYSFATVVLPRSCISCTRVFPPLFSIFHSYFYLTIALATITFLLFTVSAVSFNFHFSRVYVRIIGSRHRDSSAQAYPRDTLDIRGMRTKEKEIRETCARI